jgi:hypothetical protein
MAADSDTAQGDIVAIVCVADFLDRNLIGTNGLDGWQFAAQRDAMWTAPTTAAAGAYVAWHTAFYSMDATERRWLARAVAGDLEAAAPQPGR